jgi:hypothetical protein
MSESERPSFELDSRDPLAPRGPWSFILQAASGGLTRLGLGFLASWACFFLFSNVFWAIHLKGLAGWSSLPNYWGELLTARDIWELVENGGLKHHWTGPLAPLAAGLCFLWFLWAGWRLQTATVGLRARLGAWCWGFLDALLLGALPMLAVGFLVVACFTRLGTTGIEGLSWLDWVGGALVKLACLSAFFLQWWLCRLARAATAPGWRLGSWKALRTHLVQSFLALWMHPVQWTLLVVGGVVARLGLTFLGLFLAWRWGGGTPLKVWGFLLLQLLMVVLNAWLLGWFLRLAALYVRHRMRVGEAIRQLQAEASAGGVE